MFYLRGFPIGTNTNDALLQCIKGAGAPSKDERARRWFRGEVFQIRTKTNDALPPCIKGPGAPSKKESARRCFIGEVFPIGTNTNAPTLRGKTNAHIDVLSARFFELGQITNAPALASKNDSARRCFIGEVFPIRTNTNCIKGAGAPSKDERARRCFRGELFQIRTKTNSFRASSHRAQKVPALRTITSAHAYVLAQRFSRIRTGTNVQLGVQELQLQAQSSLQVLGLTARCTGLRLPHYAALEEMSSAAAPNLASLGVRQAVLSTPALISPHAVPTCAQSPTALPATGITDNAQPAAQRKHVRRRPPVVVLLSEVLFASPSPQALSAALSPPCVYPLRAQPSDNAVLWFLRAVLPLHPRTTTKLNAPVPPQLRPFHWRNVRCCRSPFTSKPFVSATGRHYWSTTCTGVQRVQGPQFQAFYLRFRLWIRLVTLELSNVSVAPGYSRPGLSQQIVQSYFRAAGEGKTDQGQEGENHYYVRYSESSATIGAYFTLDPEPSRNHKFLQGLSAQRSARHSGQTSRMSYTDTYDNHRTSTSRRSPSEVRRVGRVKLNAAAVARELLRTTHSSGVEAAHVQMSVQLAQIKIHIYLRASIHHQMSGVLLREGRNWLGGHELPRIDTAEGRDEGACGPIRSAPRGAPAWVKVHGRARGGGTQSTQGVLALTQWYLRGGDGSSVMAHLLPPRVPDRRLGELNVDAGRASAHDAAHLLPPLGTPVCRVWPEISQHVHDLHIPHRLTHRATSVSPTSIAPATLHRPRLLFWLLAAWDAASPFVPPAAPPPRSVHVLANRTGTVALDDAPQCGARLRELADLDQHNHPDAGAGARDAEIADALAVATESALAAMVVEGEDAGDGNGMVKEDEGVLKEGVYQVRELAELEALAKPQRPLAHRRSCMP
ncbi:hypothetical protein DFH07DRAFT_779039 [Mycena maculata]|uniref:Uncharacterized protein n=1 Tax=Mycena maculata TaxID=230809 RepID=A0AAD7IC40_9AGAR|nr:hypothetical protein DFH07DRAFT_779039 [Mycena maculata]